MHPAGPCCENFKICNRSRGYNARFTVTCHNVSVYRVPQMRGGGTAGVLPVLQMPDNKADAVPCERLPKYACTFTTCHPDAATLKSVSGNPDRNGIALSLLKTQHSRLYKKTTCLKRHVII